LKARIPDFTAVHNGQTGCVLQLRVQPGAKQNSLLFREDGRCLVRIQAPPTDGKANVALRRFLARTVLGIPQSKVRIIKGNKSRDKWVEIDLEIAQLQTLLHKYLDA
jgi:uncharacterized protein